MNRRIKIKMKKKEKYNKKKRGMVVRFPQQTPKTTRCCITLLL
jgi:hypothetical protein